MSELLARTTSRELTEWAAYEKLAGPLGPRRGDVHAAIIAAAVVNMQRKRPLPISDFLPRWDRAPKTPEQLFQAAMAANVAMGGTVRTPST
ncbi:hypothetical protein [Streptomyces sp. DH12]|uniref:phage tail assembly protein T n=1 Tax=Streptomyces sp. DH12 TaxID=2857010 RepID=UPI001E556A27|nr:hypothetical protein [Streptomyces sp. DH12]